MSRKRYKSKVEVLAVPSEQTHLPLDGRIAVYYRQSTDAQVGNISTAIQTVDMVAYLVQQGWNKDNIILIDMDEGVSGSTRIDERPGMSMLFDLITQGEIQAVACQDEDRLFRDITQIQVNIFIEACRASNVLVLTPSMIYDFANPMTGQFHARQFRFKSEMAAEYINSVIRGKLHRAKRRLLMEGRWAGAGLPPGYMIDMRKALPDGSKNDNWRKLVPFEPYAEVVREYFNLFLAKGGAGNATSRHIFKHGPFYPDPATTKPPEGFKVVYKIQKHENGYCPGRGGLSRLLTNAMYLGHWTYKGVVVQWDNHPAVVERDIFMQAFNYLSEQNLDGTPNENYRPFFQQSRPTLESERPRERPLCTGMIYGEYEGEWLRVGTNWVNALEHYTYVLWSKAELGKYVWGKAAGFVDEAIVKLLHKKLRATFDSDAWEMALATFDEEYQKERKRKSSQLTHLEQVMESQVASLDTLTNPHMIQRVQERYEESQREYERLSKELQGADDKAQQLAAIYQLKQTYDPALDNWEQLTRDEKRVVLHAFIDHIEAHRVENQGLRLVVFWRDATQNTVVLPRQSANGDGWLESELAELKQIIESRAGQIEVARAFPKRKWQNIRVKIYETLGTDQYSFHPKPILDDETYRMFMDRTNGNTIPYQAGSGARWRPEELEQLNEMLDTNSTKVELAKTFPHRNWGRIRAKVTELRGADFDIPGDKPMRRSETYATYLLRVNEEEGNGKDRPANITSESCSERARHDGPG